MPSDFIGQVMDLVVERRGVMHDMQFVSPTRVKAEYDMPLAEILYDFFDKLKSRTRGTRLLTMSSWNTDRRTL